MFRKSHCLSYLWYALRNILLNFTHDVLRKIYEYFAIVLRTIYFRTYCSLTRDVLWIEIMSFEKIYGIYEIMLCWKILTVSTLKVCFETLWHELKPFMRKFLLVYFGDILINNKSRDQHLNHLTQVCIALRKVYLYGKLKKCSFFTDKVIFLGFIVSFEGVVTWPLKSSSNCGLA